MSVNFNPDNYQQPPEKSPLTLPKASPGFFQKWLDQIREGYLVERMPAKDYCLKKWNDGEKEASKVTQEVFMKTCTEECEFYKRFCEWHRRN